MRAADLTGTASVTFKNVDGINDVTIEPVKLTNGKGDVSASTGLGALAEAINKASDKTGIKASVTAISTFEQPIKAGETTSNFSINGVKIGTVSVQEKDANGALRAAINAVKDQTGVEASVDTKGRLVLANRDGRGIKVEDNVKVPNGADDVHSLVVRDAVNGNNKKGVDLSTADAWNANGANGSILVGENSFGDVKNAHGVQDAAIYNDGLTKTKQATAASNAYNAFHTEEQKALDKFKDAAIKALDAYIGGTADTGKDLDKVKGNAAAEKLKDIIKNSTNFADITDKLDAFNTAHSAAILAANKDDLQTAITAAAQDYAKTTTTAANKELGNLAAYEQKDDVKTVNDELDKLQKKLAAAAQTTPTNMAAVKTLGTDVDAYVKAAKAAGTKEVDFANLDVAAIGAARLANTAFNNGANPTTAKEITDLFNSLKTQTTKADANATIDKLTKKLEEVVNAADGKAMNTAEAQQGMVAHSYLQFFAGVKAGLNEPDNAGLSSIIGLNTTNSTNMGRLSLVANNGRDIQVEVKDANGFVSNSALGFDKNVSEATVSLRETNATISRAQADAMGFNNEEWQAGDNGDNQNGYAAGVMTLKGAQAMMNIAETAQKALEAIRSDLGSVQNQLVSTVNNISVTQVNVKSAESNIRDVDFASESATFSKHQILAQSGVYAMSQANAVQQNVMRLLQ
ncbi:flagellin [Campylobacter sp. RM12654]|uniref:flagellin n=2 Tax=unclassified Campylobacter TaxID=2593542 RepID=UPI00301565C6